MLVHSIFIVITTKGFPGGSAGKESTCNCRRPQFNSWVKKVPWRKDKLPTPVFLGLPGSSNGKESACNAGDLRLIPGLERPPGGGHGNTLHYSCLEDPHGQRSLVGYSPWGHRVRHYKNILKKTDSLSYSSIDQRSNMNFPGLRLKYLEAWGRICLFQLVETTCIHCLISLPPS